ncbi:DUF6314 family protein [Reinekea thalattae]|uniref:DUF6314 domain-containing protein n=1 Tax=Reinekea thalattae TaxID=2593301 RepID=A0A5C8Z956_9GAMM|nr:DUF6314 family protein [Reinekea thalattae]TXR54685.1 hypothetical protein FME95_09150 [Reinekea thalattae]
MYFIQADQVGDYFLGSWKVKRSITGFGEISGDARFRVNQDDPDVLDFNEAMILPNSDKANAFRSYQYRIQKNGFDIFFSDGPDNGKLFLSFSFNKESTLTSHHLCIKDHYDARFQFNSENNFVLSFSVVGPKKDYQIHSTFHRDSF